MKRQRLIELASDLLERFCLDIPTRPVGRDGNRRATDLFAARMRSCGFDVSCPEFRCIDWATEGAWLQTTAGRTVAHASPYSPGCDTRGRLRVASTVADLEAADLAGSVVLLRGELTRGQLMPKNFPWYNPEEHQHIIALLEEKRPLAIVAATSRDPEMVGAQYPFPFIEDGDFDIPSVYLTDVEGDALARLTGQEVAVVSRSRRIASSGCNVVARKGSQASGWIVCTAHIDTRDGTPGALDNASGTISLLLLGELLRDLEGLPPVEIVALNGEDYYASSGEKLYFDPNRECMDRIGLNINIDDVGYRDGATAYSLYECPAELAFSVRSSLGRQRGIIEGPAWPQGDHMIFVQSGRPALAFTSEKLTEVMAEYTHTPRDRPELVDPAKLADLALALRGLLPELPG
ncbi:MAG TPA: M28 family peptidase [Anaerolineae bacterium]|nr:M28 family peptidase [Anaerolineae bacterium]HQJ51269.1 M28 family peptidase [Anaerolineae bacterium]